MPASVTDYERRTTLSRNPLARLSHRARIRQALTLIGRYLPAKGAVLDFGCGQGQLLAHVRLRFPDARLYGLDPFRSGTGYNHLRTPAECEGLAFEVITAFEVLEHLDQVGIENFFRLVESHLAPNGACIISVPNLLGPALLPKVLHGSLFSGSALNYGAADVMRAVVMLRSPQRLRWIGRALCVTRALTGETSARESPQNRKL